MSTIGPSLFILVPVTFALAVVMLVVAIFQDAKKYSRAQAIKYSFFAVMAMLALLASVGSLVALGYLGLRTWVFEDAKYQRAYNATPPGLYAYTMTPEETEFAACTTETTTCPYTDSQKENLGNWQQQYANWQTQQSVGIRQDLIDALSVLAIALPLFALFYAMLRRSQKAVRASATKDVYYYGIAFMALAVAVTSTGVLLNAALKTWILPANENAAITDRFMPELGGEKTNVEHVATCVSVCELGATYADDTSQWLDDNTVAEEKIKAGAYHDTYAASIPLILFGVPIFAYHFIIARKESEEAEARV